MKIISCPGKYYLVLFFVITLHVLLYSGASAAEPFILDEHMYNSSLGMHVEYLEDPGGKLTIKDVTDLDASGSVKWRKSDSEVPSFGFSEDPYWLRFSVKNRGRVKINWYLEIGYPVIDHIELFIPEKNGRYNVKRAGDRLPFHDREVDFRTFLFPLVLKPGVSQTYYLRLETETSMIVPVSAWTLSGLTERTNREQPVYWIFYGFLISMIIINLFFLIFARDINNFYFSIFVASYGLMQLAFDGLAYQYLWPESVWWASNGIPFLVDTAALAAVLFFRKFLRIYEQAPWINYLTYFLYGLAGLGMAFALFGPFALSNFYCNVVTLVTIIPLLAISLVLAVRGSRPARFYITGWGMMIIGAGMTVMKSFGILPPVFIVNWSMQAGFLLQVVLLTYGITDRINVMRREREEQSYLVEETNRNLLERTGEMTDIMDNIEEGILTIDRDYRINQEYSGFIEKIFGKKDLAGKNFIDLIYFSGNEEKRKELEEYLEILFTNVTTSDEVLAELNPIKHFEHAFFEVEGEVDVKYLHFNFVRIYMEERLLKIMVIVRDLTDEIVKERQRVQERIEHEEELERISALIRIPNQELDDYLVRCVALSFRMEEFFGRHRGLVESDNMDLKGIRTDLHSLKGEARLYNLNKFAEMIHRMEDRIARVYRKDETPGSDEEPDSMNVKMEIMLTISEFNIYIQNIKETRNRIVEKVREEEEISKLTDSSVLREFFPKLHSLNRDLNLIINSMSRFEDNSDNIIKYSWAGDLDSFLQRAADEMKKKGRVRKLNPLVITSSLSEREIFNLSPFRASVIHLLQNALIHGIEDPENRLAQGKNEKGTIRLGFTRGGPHNGTVDITVEDDGSGINISRIQDVLRHKNEMSHEEIQGLTAQEAIKLIFMDGFSSETDIDVASGRGVGMEAVRKTVNEYGGKIRVRNNPGRGLTIVLSVPYPLKERRGV